MHPRYARLNLTNFRMSSSNSVSFKITIDDEFKSQIFEKISPEFRVSVQGQLVPFATRIELDLVDTTSYTDSIDITFELASSSKYEVLPITKRILVDEKTKAKSVEPGLHHYRRIRFGDTLVTIKEDFGVSLGTSVWDSGILMAKHIADKSFCIDLCGKTVLELGSGVGLSGIVALECGGAKFVTFTDRSKEYQLLLDNVHRNCKKNQLYF